jgi:hypothetical protein
MTTTDRTWINVYHEGHPYRLQAAWHRMESPIDIHAPNGLEPVPTGWSVADIPDGPEEIGTRAIAMLAQEGDIANWPTSRPRGHHDHSR